MVARRAGASAATPPQQTLISRFFAAGPAPPSAPPAPAQPPAVQPPIPSPAHEPRGDSSPSEQPAEEVSDAEIEFSVVEFAFEGGASAAPVELARASTAPQRAAASRKRPASTAAGGERAVRARAPPRTARGEASLGTSDSAHADGNGGGLPPADGGADADAPGSRLLQPNEPVPAVEAVAARLGLSQLTPLERQVVALKARHPGHVLMFEVGYKYHMYGEDAGLAASVLHIRAYTKHHLVCASVPANRRDVHLQRLLHAGLRVGVVEQAETAARKKAGVGAGARSGTFERELSALYSRGTFVPPSDGASLQPSNRVLCVHELPPAVAVAGSGGGARIAIVVLDMYSTELVVDEFDDGPLRSELHARLTALAPAEVLAPRALPARPRAAMGTRAAMGMSEQTAMAVAHYAASGAHAADSAPSPALGAAACEDDGAAAADDASADPAAALPLGAAPGAAAGQLARLELVEPGSFDLGAALELLAARDGGAAEDEAEAARAIERASALPTGVGLALGALAHHLRGLLGERTCGRLLRLGVCACERWTDAAACALGAQLLRDLQVVEPPPSATAPPAGAAATAGGARGSLFSHLNRTRTQPGARLLHRWLCAPLRCAREIGARLQAVEELREALDEDDSGARAPRGRAAAGARRLFGSSPPARASADECAGVAVARPAPTVFDLLRHLAALPCRDVERALSRLVSGRCAPAELWHLLHALESTLELLVRGVRTPDAAGARGGGADTPTRAAGVAPPPAASPRLLERLLPGADGSGGPTSEASADAALLEAVRGWMRGLRREGMLAGQLAAAFEIDSGTQPALSETQSRMDAILRALHEQELPAARRLLRRPSLAFKTVLKDEFLLEVPVALASQMPPDWTRVCATKACVRFRPPEVERAVAQLGVLRETFELQAEEAFGALCARVRAHTPRIRALVHRLATLDVLCAFAEVARAHAYARPTVLDGARAPPTLQLSGARHPTVELAMRAGQAFVPNDVQLGGGAEPEPQAAAGPAAHAPSGAAEPSGPQVVLLFGPNSGGKSLLARTALTIALMAQAGCFVPAEAATLTPCDGLYTRIGSSDNILRGESTFMVELSEAAAIMARATHRSLVLFDELGRGTSTHDGTAIAMATLEHLITRTRALGFFISHYPLLAQLEVQYPRRLACAHMAYVERTRAAGPPAAEAEGAARGAEAVPPPPARGERAAKEITMLYRVTRGKLETSFGVNVARLAQLPEPVLLEAARRSEALERLVAHRRLLCALRRALGAGSAAPRGADAPQPGSQSPPSAAAGAPAAAACGAERVPADGPASGADCAEDAVAAAADEDAARLEALVALQREARETLRRLSSH